ncbi:hypothetical protein HK098_008017 [Nowakowskiella sp. JEL0407]|nr:hypothetical protein HK098_008017 [Nowakowskiella sp. JEL0407]
MSTVSNTNHGHSSNSSSLFLSPESNGGFMHPSHLMRRDSDISMENFSTNSIPDSPTLQFTGINIPSSPKFAESGRRILHPGRIHRGRQKTHSFHSFNTIPTTDMQLDDIKIDLSFSNGADRMVKSPLRSSISKTRHKSALRSISPHPDFDNRFISRLLKEDSQVIDKEIAHEKITTSFLRTGVPPPVSSEKSHKESVLRNSTQAETESIGTDSPRSMASFVDDWAMDGFDLPLRVSPIPANLIKSPVPYLSNSSKLNPENSFISRQSELLSSPSLSPLSNSALYGLFPGLERNKRKQSVDADQQEPSKRQLRFNSPPTLSLHHERSMSPYQLPHSSSISLGKTQSLSSSDLSDAGQNLFANHEQNILSSKSTEKNAKASSSGSTGWTANGPRGQNQVHVLLNSNPLFTRRLLNIQGAEGDLKNLKID